MNNKSQKIRAFIAVEIPEKVRAEIAQLIDRFAKNEPSVKWVKEDNLHITLLFLGEIDNDFLEKSINQLNGVARIKKGFRMSLKNFGAFPSQRSPRVLWIGIEQGAQELIDLQTAVESAFTTIGYKPEERKFHPHLTIGRVRDRIINAEPIFSTTYQSDVFNVKSIVLFKSTLTPQGPIYDKIREFPLLV
ncbi:MAG: RNA 2',3'-cyclic phosphodiesterase [candidate division WOR-3 bacterium]|nr:RNA 2',3'-cyclic phosphodiesterase [candidate division WOR-3 bacterium]